MSCTKFDGNQLKDFALGELDNEARRAVERHVDSCPACRDELARLQLTQDSLFALREEEPPRRIAFVSDKVFEPNWWQRMWRSGPQAGFASAAMLACAILAHGYLARPASVPVAQVDQREIDARIEAAVKARTEEILTRVVAAGEQRHQETLKLVNATQEKIEQERKADQASVEESYRWLQKYIASMRRESIAASMPSPGVGQ